MWRSLLVAVLLAGCSDSLTGHWSLTMTGSSCQEGHGWFDLLDDGTIEVPPDWGHVTQQYIGEPASRDAELPSISFSTERTIYGEGGHVNRAFRLWLSGGSGSGTETSSYGSCDVSASR